MSNLAKRDQTIDPAFQAVYDSVSGESDSRATPTDSERPSTERREATATPGSGDDFEVAVRMARENQARQTVDRKQLTPGNQIEHDVFNAGKLFFDYMTRPL